MLTLCSHAISYAQDFYKFGPSVLFSYDNFTGALVVGYGGEISYEKSVKEKHSFNIGLSANYGSRRNREELSSNLDQTALFLGGFAEFRIHFEERFNGGFIGFGFDIKYADTEYLNNSIGTSGILTTDRITSTEGNLTFSIGEIFDYDNGKYISPFIKLGVGIFANEYPVNGQLSLVLGF